MYQLWSHDLSHVDGLIDTVFIDRYASAYIRTPAETITTTWKMHCYNAMLLFYQKLSPPCLFSMQSLKITTPITRNACFFSADTAHKASEINPREASELNLGQNFHQHLWVLMVSAEFILMLMVSAGFQVELWKHEFWRPLCSTESNSN